MRVIKRNGEYQQIHFDKIHDRILYLVNSPFKLNNVNGDMLSKDIINTMYDGIRTDELDEYAAQKCAEKVIQHLEYGILAGRIIINNHHKKTKTSFKDKMESLYRQCDTHGKNYPLVNPIFMKFIEKNQEAIEKMIDYNRDYFIDYFGFKTLEKAYLMKINGKIIERPQDLFMRVSIFIHMDKNDYKSYKNLQQIHETYEYLSHKYFTHATPTLFNAGSVKPQCFSCFLIGTGDSLDEIHNTLKNACKISKWAGGIGIHVSNIRSCGSLIRGTNGNSSGLISQMRMFNEGALAYDQGGRRPGSWAFYLEPHHADIIEFLKARRPETNPRERCEDLFYAVWISDLFMNRVKNDEVWSLFCPDKCPNLSNVYGEEYEKLYKIYEDKKFYKKQVKAREIWRHIYDTQKITGMPYILYKDNVNNYNMQSNLGTIKSSNLCVSGDTLILTEFGYYPIRTLEGVHSIWNGHEFTNATFAKTGESQDLILVETSHGYVKCTPYHKFILKNGDRIDAQLLKIGDELARCQFSKLQFNYILEAHQLLTTCIYDSNMNFNNYDDAIFIRNQCHLLGLNPYINNGHYGYYLTFDLHDYDNLKVLLGEEVAKSLIYSEYKPNIVLNVESLDVKEDTYCFKEPIMKQGVFNGLLLGNCSEIVEYSDSEYYSVCCLASICLPQFVEDSPESKNPNNEFPENPIFNYAKLANVVGIIVNNLNKIIDKNYYPVVETARMNFITRPLGIGVQGLADVFMKFKCSFESELAIDLNKKIFETIYYSAITKSAQLSREFWINANESLENNGYYIYENYSAEVLECYPELYRWRDYIYKKYESGEEIPMTIGAYSKYEGSIISQGKFHWELYDATTSGKWDWETTRSLISKFGVRNSLLVAIMPTASTSQIMGNIESIECYKTNIYRRNTSAGEFILCNKYLQNDIQQLNGDIELMKNYILCNNGSVQNIDGLSKEYKDIYKTIYEIDQKAIIKLAVDRQPFVDQSQSLNLHVADLNYKAFNNMQFLGWKNKLKTGCYYMRTLPSALPQKFTIDPNLEKQLRVKKVEIDNDDTESCLACGS